MLKYSFKNIVSVLIIIVFTFISCDEDVEINLGNIQEPVVAQFQVDFDGETWVADRTVSVINNGVTTITAFKNNDAESIVITLQSDEVGAYTFDNVTNVGHISYAESPTAQLYTSTDPNPIGRVDVTEIDTQNQLISGTFFFLGTRTVQQFDVNGNPVLDADGNPVYEVQSKDFTNGIFNNLVYTTTITEPTPTEPNTDEFYVKIDGIEFVEETLSAIKSDISGISVITIRATRDGSNNIFEIQVPADIVTGNNLLVSSTTDPANDTVATYRILSTSQNFGAAASSTIPLPLLQITQHDVANKKLEGTFEFTAVRIGGGTETIEFTEGTFSVTYTE